MAQRIAAIALILGLWLGSVGPVQAAAGNASPLAVLPFLGDRFAGQRPANLGVRDGHLAACPASPNCVVSQGATDAVHAIEPLPYEGDPARAMARLEAILRALPRTAIIERRDDYLYAEFTSRWMGYVDDGEFYLDPKASVIQVRSASRLGESDLGVNRNRIEAIRSAFAV
ncbi:MAG TPA: DUF1499 domain-containing protein [Leptolyngbyaceae cyanobacterium M65_K2018_010]|nr:DUF1499 domain-containing protein [Leptolyngbyaceae cyanobacterium M65_K2018_010]